MATQLGDLQAEFRFILVSRKPDSTSSCNYIKANEVISGRREPIQVQWFLPRHLFLKLNVDGSFHNNPGAFGFGGIIRDNFGQWVVGFSGSYCVTSNLNAELFAIYHAFVSCFVGIGLLLFSIPIVKAINVWIGWLNVDLLLMSLL
ncbi:hypothetical protein JHK85_010689 [Glycine max]|nr:hypothetical protein JHK85_010689 [Glycine max]